MRSGDPGGACFPNLKIAQCLLLIAPYQHLAARLAIEGRGGRPGGYVGPAHRYSGLFVRPRRPSDLAFGNLRTQRGIESIKPVDSGARLAQAGLKVFGQAQ